MKNFSIFQKAKITSIAIGGFDGMHLGHQKLFSYLDKNGAIAVIETGYANLTPKANRASKTDFPLVYYPLEQIKHLQGTQFIDLLKEEFPALQKIVVGFDFCFGANRKYCVEELKQLFHGEIIVVKEIKKDGIGIHSALIRKYLKDGQLNKANQFLGKEYQLNGRIIKGQGLGKKQFVPTLNIDVQDFLIPQEGIYATKTIIDNSVHNSVTFIGHRVTTDGKFAIETHILDTEIHPQSHSLDIQFYKKLRNNEKFEEFELLKQQILKDIHNTKHFFSS
ncbi:MAG: bifunctional riboflavin kinase/FAD synthetase [Campylobacterota bacterium]|nr:bifunctional riboflavin kinase/FAD synthetase [Campylobacterota bacterium]